MEPSDDEYEPGGQREHSLVEVDAANDPAEQAEQEKNIDCVEKEKIAKLKKPNNHDCLSVR